MGGHPIASGDGIQRRLVPGQRADFLLIDRDISTAQPADIRTTQVLETWIGGKRVYVKGQ